MSLSKEEISRINRVHKKMILDYSGIMPLKTQPKSIKEINQLISLFEETEPSRFKEAYMLIVLKRIPGEEDSEEKRIAVKAIDLVEESIDNQMKRKKDEISKHLLSQYKDAQENILSIAQREISKAREQFKTIRIKTGDKKPVKIKEILCDQFEHILQLAQQRVNIMMIGPAGSGKTHIGSQVAKVLDLDFASQSCSAGMSESQLTGWLLPIEDNGKFEYVQSEFIRIYENGGVFLFDEMDAADPNVMIFINQALANGQFSLPQRFKNPTVKKHRDFVAIAACNTFGGGADGMYHARNALDASTIDRFKIGMVEIGYSAQVEDSLGNEEVTKFARNVRKVIKEHSLRRVMSTRVVIDGSKMMEGQDWSIGDVMKSYFLDWSTEEKKLYENYMEKLKNAEPENIDRKGHLETVEEYFQRRKEILDEEYFKEENRF